MWFLFSVLAAIFYSLMWILTRMSKGIPAPVVFTVQFAYGPLFLYLFGRNADYPWHEFWWWLYLLLPLVIIPLMGCAMTVALHRMQVTLIKPLFGLSSVATLIVASTFFGERVTTIGVLGIFVITVGLLCLYHGRFDAWRTPWPWIGLLGAFVFGSNAAVVGEVLSRFPNVLALSAVVMTGSFVMGSIPASFTLKDVVWNKRTILICFGLMCAMLGQDVASLYALMLGPSSYVISVKRCSILLTALIGYLFLHEQDQSLSRLLVASGLVVLGVVMLTLG